MTDTINTPFADPRPDSSPPRAGAVHPSGGGAGSASHLVEVAVDALGLPGQSFTYSVPPELAVAPGHLVWVPYGASLLRGVVLGAVAESPVDYARPIVALAGPEPLLDAPRLSLVRWLSARYLCTLFQAADLFLPPGTPRAARELLRLADDSVAPAEPLARQIWQRLAREPLAYEAAIQGLKRGARSALAALEEHGLVMRELLPADQPVVAPLARFVALRPGHQAAPPLKLSEAQAILVEALHAAEAAGNPWVLAETLVELTGANAAALRGLIKRGVVLERQRVVGEGTAPTPRPASQRVPGPLREAGGSKRLPAPVATGEGPGMRAFPSPWPSLTSDQRAVWETLREALEANREPRVSLIYGVTASGKTELYLRACAETLARGGRILILVPEIALTSQLVQTLAARFPGQVALLHSRLGAAEQRANWWRIKHGQADIVLGTRSALFAPVPALRLIVLDEEHEWTYKQSDPAPRYVSRDVAERLAGLVGAPVLLASATPDVVSYQRATVGRYRRLSLPRRVPSAGSGDLPPIEVVDLRAELRAGNRQLLSGAMRHALVEVLEQREQAILFLNRRGRSGVVLCRNCGFVRECPRCDTPLTYHAEPERYLCHLCNWATPASPECPRCGHAQVRLLGAGTERVVEELGQLFPSARVLRWDSDSTSQRGSHDALLSRFQAHEADILVGTQMIAKGLNLPQVTVVGVVNADVGLHLPDYRAGERVFQLLTQVAGRAGRGPRGGRVIVQTFSPEHYVIQAAGQHDYRSFVRTELNFRRQHHLPPYGELVRLVYAARSARSAESAAQSYAARLKHERQARGLLLDILGPAPAYITRLREHYRWQIVLRGRDPAAFLAAAGVPRGWQIDVDPVSLL